MWTSASNENIEQSKVYKIPFPLSHDQESLFCYRNLLLRWKAATDDAYSGAEKKLFTDDELAKSFLLLPGPARPSKVLMINCSAVCTEYRAGTKLLKTFNAKQWFNICIIKKWAKEVSEHVLYILNIISPLKYLIKYLLEVFFLPLLWSSTTLHIWSVHYICAPTVSNWNKVLKGLIYEVTCTFFLFLGAIRFPSWENVCGKSVSPLITHLSGAMKINLPAFLFLLFTGRGLMPELAAECYIKE